LGATQTITRKPLPCSIQFVRELLNVWLNIANGGIDFAGVSDILAVAKSICLEPSAGGKRDQGKLERALVLV
jgi:hypothetical protein